MYICKEQKARFTGGNHFGVFVLSETKPVFVINVVQISPFVEKGFYFFMIAFLRSVIQVFVDLPRLK